MDLSFFFIVKTSSASERVCTHNFDSAHHTSAETDTFMHDILFFLLDYCDVHVSTLLKK